MSATADSCLAITLLQRSTCRRLLQFRERERGRERARNYFKRSEFGLVKELHSKERERERKELTHRSEVSARRKL